MINLTLLTLAIIFLMKISYQDYKTKTIYDIDSLIIMVLAIFYNVNDFSNFDDMVLNFKLIAYSIGSVFVFKVIVENILYTFKKLDDDLIGEGDLILFGGLAPFLKTYSNLLIMFYMALMIILMYLFILSLSNRKAKKVTQPFVPAIFTAFIITVISTLI